MTTFPDEVAYPHFDQTGVAQDHTIGLTKREYFAAIALQGLLANSYVNQFKGHVEGVTGLAISYADQLISQLNKD